MYEWASRGLGVAVSSSNFLEVYSSFINSHYLCIYACCTATTWLTPHCRHWGKAPECEPIHLEKTPFSVNKTCQLWLILWKGLTYSLPLISYLFLMCLLGSLWISLIAQSRYSSVFSCFSLRVIGGGVSCVWKHVANAPLLESTT